LARRIGLKILRARKRWFLSKFSAAIISVKTILSDWKMILAEPNTADRISHHLLLDREADCRHNHQFIKSKSKNCPKYCISKSLPNLALFFTNHFLSDFTTKGFGKLRQIGNRTVDTIALMRMRIGFDLIAFKFRR
jgi:hypothetical protein